jgi:flagellar secretion chaperone FliS
MNYVAAAPQAAYRRGEVLAASPGQLVVLLYDAARRFLRKAAMAMRAGDVETAHKCLRAAERVIAHLDGTLDYDHGDLPQRLHALYRFHLAHLDRARLNQDPAIVEQVSELLGELRDAWAEVANEAERT